MTRRAAALPPAFLAVIFLIGLWLLRDSPARVSGDESTYIAMAESLALDLDLRFDSADRSRLTAGPRAGRESVILQRTSAGISYSKPLVYPLFSAPFFRVWGQRGMVFFNVLCLVGALWLLARWLARIGKGWDPMITLATFAGAGILLVYIPWRTSDLMQAAFTMSGLALSLEGIRDAKAGYSSPRSRAQLIAGGILLGVTISLRLTNALIAVIPVVALLAVRRRQSALIAAVALVGTVLAAAGTTQLLTGAPSPYRAVRATFNTDTGYPVGPEAENAAGRFDFDRATYDSKKRLVESPLASVYSGVYFLFGRYTGLLLYFPMAFALAGSALRRADRVSWVVLSAVGALSVFYLVYLPFNYFGGAACVGNRYFLVSYAALPFALRRPPSRRLLTAVWILALLTAGSALVSVVSTRDRDTSLLNHAHAGIFRWLPYESTAAGLAGGQDVFWTQEFARFVDPYVRVSRWKFRLNSADPATEVAVANRRSDEQLRFLVLSSAPELELVYSDWGRRVRTPLKNPLGKRGLVEIEPSRPLRYHPLWFRNAWDHGLPYHVRVFRLAIRSPGDEPVEAEIRYLGQEPWPREAFSREVLKAEVPERATAGTSSSISVRLRNTSEESWRGQGVFPVYLSFRLTPLDGKERLIEGSRTPIGQVAPGGEVARTLIVEWPELPGRYRLTVDLLIEGVSWFEKQVGEPLSRTEVTVEPR